MYIYIIIQNKYLFAFVYKKITKNDFRYQTSLNIVTSYYQRYEEKLDNIDNGNGNEIVISKLFLLKVSFFFFILYYFIYITYYILK